MIVKKGEYSEAMCFKLVFMTPETKQEDMFTIVKENTVFVPAEITAIVFSCPLFDPLISTCLVHSMIVKKGEYSEAMCFKLVFMTPETKQEDMFTIVKESTVFVPAEITTIVFSCEVKSLGSL
ncbi:hypothetical protein Tco_0156824 [Tanacetum coccineum]